MRLKGFSLPTVWSICPRLMLPPVQNVHTPLPEPLAGQKMRELSPGNYAGRGRSCVFWELKYLSVESDEGEHG